MSVKITTEGIDELRNELLKLGSKADGIIDNALMEAAKPIRDEMQNNINKSKLNKKHLKDNIPINKEPTIDGNHAVSVGWTKEDNSEFFYSKYLEWGTSKMDAKPFMQPAIDKKEKKAYEILIDEIIKGLGI